MALLCIGNFLVFEQLGHVPGTKLYSVWEPTTRAERRYVIMRKFEGMPGFWGRLGSERIPNELKFLPPGHPKREQSVLRRQSDAYESAYQLICEAFPAAEAGMASGGFISLTTAAVLQRDQE